jgi:hypothetical protein
MEMLIVDGYFNEEVDGDVDEDTNFLSFWDAERWALVILRHSFKVVPIKER